MFAENRKISLRQVQALFFLDSFGTATLFLPAELARSGGKACWISALLGGLFCILLLQLLAAVGKRLPCGTAVEWFRGCFGFLGGDILLVGLMGMLLFDAAMELRLLSEVLCHFLLPATPLTVISLLLLAAAAAFAAQGTECRGRAAEILFFTAALPLFFLLLAVAASSRYQRVLPLSLPTVSAVGAGIRGMSIVFQSGIFLYFIFPELKQSARAPRAFAKSSLILTGVVTALVFLALAVYGEDTLAGKLLPGLQVLERVSFTGVFLTRQDVLLLWFWVVSAVVFLSGILFFGSLLSVKLCREPEQKRKTWLWVWLLAIFALSFLPETLSAAYHLRLAVAPWFHFFYLGVLPLLLLFRIKKGGLSDE